MNVIERDATSKDEQLKFKVAGDATEATLTRIKEGQQQRQQPTQAVKGMGR